MVTINTIYFWEILLVPLLLGIVIALARKSPLRTILALAIAALPFLAAGVILYDVVTGFQNEIGLLSAHFSSYTLNLNTIQVAFAIISAGSALASAAAIIAMSRAASLRQWGWFAVIFATTILTAIIAYGFTQGFPAQLFGADLQARLYMGDRSFSLVFYLITSALLVLTPVTALLYGLRASDEPNDAPLPPTA